MTRRRHKLNLAYSLLLVAIAVLASFSYWLLKESEAEKVRRVFLEHESLELQGRSDEAVALFERALADVDNAGALDPVWLPFIRMRLNGYEQLEYFARVLAGDPDREMTYAEIADLIKFAPEAFHREIKRRYLTELAAIPEVREEWLEKYHLSVE